MELSGRREGKDRTGDAGGEEGIKNLKKGETAAEIVQARWPSNLIFSNGP